jgi:hypothetical protein
MLEILNFDQEKIFISRMATAMPIGFNITRVKCLAPYQTGNKKISLASLFWGSLFLIKCNQNPGIIIKLYDQITHLPDNPFNSALISYSMDNGFL